MSVGCRSFEHMIEVLEREAVEVADDLSASALLASIKTSRQVEHA